MGAGGTGLEQQPPQTGISFPSPVSGKGLKAQGGAHAASYLENPAQRCLGKGRLAQCFPCPPPPPGEIFPRPLEAEANGTTGRVRQETTPSSVKDSLCLGWLYWDLSSSLLVFEHPFFYELGIVTGDCLILMSLLGEIKRQ